MKRKKLTKFDFLTLMSQRRLELYIKKQIESPLFINTEYLKDGETITFTNLFKRK